MSGGNILGRRKWQEEGGNFTSEVSCGSEAVRLFANLGPASRIFLGHTFRGVNQSGKSCGTLYNDFIVDERTLTNLSIPPDDMSLRG